MVTTRRMAWKRKHENADEIESQYAIPLQASPGCALASVAQVELLVEYNVVVQLHGLKRGLSTFDFTAKAQVGGSKEFRHRA
jgi:hypothetical protein